MKERDSEMDKVIAYFEAQSNKLDYEIESYGSSTWINVPLTKGHLVVEICFSDKKFLGYGISKIINDNGFGGHDFFVIEWEKAVEYIKSIMTAS